MVATQEVVRNGDGPPEAIRRIALETDGGPIGPQFSSYTPYKPHLVTQPLRGSVGGVIQFKGGNPSGAERELNTEAVR